MERFARRVPGGGIAWENSIFNASQDHDSSRLLDAAVDIAWERLIQGASVATRNLAINNEGRLLVFRLGGRA